MGTVRTLLYVCLLLVAGCVKSLPRIVHRVTPSVVMIEVTSNDGGERTGSGVVIGHNRILTARHVVDDANLVTVLFNDGIRCDAVRWCGDPSNDLGLIDIDVTKKLESLLLERDECIVGEQVFAIGSPYGLFNSFSVGYVSALDRYFDFFGEDDLLQLDIAANLGNSGCPIFNMQGHIVGILVGGINWADGINIAIPADTCKEFIDAIATW